MIYSGSNPCGVSPKCYRDIEVALDQWYNSENNPYRHLFMNARRVDQKYITEKLDLVIMDYGKDGDRGRACEHSTLGLIVVELQGKENSEYKPFREVFDKTYGEIV